MKPSENRLLFFYIHHHQTSEPLLGTADITIRDTDLQMLDTKQGQGIVQ